MIAVVNLEKSFWKRHVSSEVKICLARDLYGVSGIRITSELLIFAILVVYCYKSASNCISVESRHSEECVKGVCSKEELIEIFIQALGKMPVLRCPDFDAKRYNKNFS